VTVTDLDQRLARLDRPRPLPSELRARLEARLTVAMEADVSGVDKPRPLPPRLRARLEHHLVRPAAPGVRLPRPQGVPALAVAAVLLLLVGLAAVTRVDRDAAGRSDRQEVSTGGIGPGEQTRRGASGISGAAGAGPTTTTAEAGNGAASSSAGRSSGGGAASAEGDAASVRAAPLAAVGGAPAATVAVAHDDVHQYAGFLAYVDELNAEGDYHIALTSVGDENAHLTVNLSEGTLAEPDGTAGGAALPLLETLAVTEDQLHGGVYSFAPPIERVAHLAADALFPTDAAGATAAVYYEPASGGGYGETAASAIEEVLVGRGVAVVRSPWNGSAANQLVPADAAYVILAAGPAGEWLRAAVASGYAPPRGIAGLHTLLDERLLPDLTDLAADVTIVSPYLLPDGDDADRIRAKITAVSAGEEPAQLSAAAVHGWVTAHAVAEVLRRIVEGRATDITSALDRLGGWESGLFPAYEVRGGTHARTPEATLFGVRAGSFISDGQFRRDRH
jgi:hypothetical protein